MKRFLLTLSIPGENTGRNSTDVLFANAVVSNLKTQKVHQ